MIGRRDLVALVGVAAAWPLRAVAQAASGLPLVAVLWPGSPETESDFVAALRGGLKEGGIVEGTGFSFVLRYAEGQIEHFASLAAEIALLKPQVIVTAAIPAVRAVRMAAPAVPVVFMGIPGDPVALGFAESFSRPGGLVTGSVSNAAGGEEALVRKRIGFLKELAPGLARLGLIGSADGPLFVAEQNGTKDASQRLGVEVLPLPIRTLDDVEAAFATGLNEGADAFYVDGSPLLFNNRTKVADVAAHAGKPTVCSYSTQARAGLLMAYSPDIADLWRHAGLYAAKILAGQKPGDLPIEQADKFTLTLNLKTAKALGIAIPPRLLLLADETIE